MYLINICYRLKESR